MDGLELGDEVGGCYFVVPVLRSLAGLFSSFQLDGLLTGIFAAAVVEFPKSRSIVDWL